MFVFLIILYGNPFTVRFHLPFSQSDSIYPFYSQIPYTPFTVRFHLLQSESDSIYPFYIQIPSTPFSVRFHLPLFQSDSMKPLTNLSAIRGREPPQGFPACVPVYIYMRYEAMFIGIWRPIGVVDIWLMVRLKADILYL